MFASAALAVALAITPLAGSGAGPEEAIAGAIVRAVRLRLGSTASVAVASLDGVRLAPRTIAALPATDSTFVAVPEPAARLGAPVRFLLSIASPGRQAVRVGEAVAVLDVTAPLVETTREVARGERLLDTDVTMTAGRLDRTPLRSLLTLDEVLGARATRDISAGTMLTRADVAPEALVHAGQIVRARARVGDVEIVGDMLAADSGHAGNVIRVVNQQTKHAARARVVGRGEVEVVNVR